jgi:tetratricopeptide (TPR) repeat protein
MEQGDMEGSLASFLQAEKVDEKCVDAQYYLGLVNERVNHREEALVRYQKAAELDGQNSQYVVAAAEVLIDMSRLDEAAAYLASKSEKFQHSAGVCQTLGHLAMMQKNPEKAVEEFNEARLLAPEDTAIIEDLIHAEMEVGRYADAELHLQKLIQNDKNRDRRDLRHLRAECLVKVERNLDARELLIALTSGAEGQADVEAWIGLGNVSYILKDNGRLKLAANRTVAIAPTRPEGYVLRALHQRRAGDLKSAEINLRQALGYKAESETYLLLAIVQDELQRPQDARETLAVLLKQEPDNAGAKQLMASIGQSVAATEEK